MLQHVADTPDAQIIIGTSHEAAGVARFAAANRSVHLWELGDDHLIEQLR
jgi:hypothetical protein